MHHSGGGWCSEGGCVRMRGQGEYMVTLYFLLNFGISLKLLCKIGSIKKHNPLWSGFSYFFKIISASFSPCCIVHVKLLCFLEAAMFLFTSEPLPISSDFSSSVAIFFSCHPLSFIILNVLSRVCSLSHSKFLVHLAHCSISSAGHKKPDQ